MFTKTQSVFERVKRDHYGESRLFHGADRPVMILRALEVVIDKIHHWPAVEIAAWWGSSVYTPGDSDNTDRSIKRMWNDLGGLAAKPLLEYAETLIRYGMAGEVVPTNVVFAIRSDLDYFSDAHISYFGSAPFRFSTVESLYRQEALSRISVEQYAVHRLILLRRLMARPSIYSTPEFKATLEHTARDNISILITSLEKEIKHLVAV